MRSAPAATAVPAGAPLAAPVEAPPPAAPRERIPDRGPAPPSGGRCGWGGRPDPPRAPTAPEARECGPRAPERRPAPPAPASVTEPRTAPAATPPDAPTRGPSPSTREYLPPGAVGIAADRPPPAEHTQSPPGERDDAAAGGGHRWAALRDRLPLWVRLRCGLEPRALTALVVVLAAAALFAGQHFWAAGPRQVPVPETLSPGDTRSQPLPPLEPASAAVPPQAAAAPAGPKTRIVVDVGGKVRRPGVFHLPAGSRVQDALKAAGGPEEGADLTGLNQARILADGEQVVAGLPLPAGEPAPGSAAPGPATGPISLNTATGDQLETLPGVGPVLAGHIIDHRMRTGGFRSVDELRDVTGIGERRFAELRHRVRP
ncbi:ComEA family DNA-binding protein [Streptomyces sp. C10-9-1]|nr:ComEA family DNA-binding protein [Streptomyces sp. C10-9-1]